MNSIPDQLEQQRIQRAQDMAKVQGREPVGIPSTPWGIYTWKTADNSTVCHIYVSASDGSQLTQEIAASKAQAMKDSGLIDGYMIEPQESLPS